MNQTDGRFDITFIGSKSMTKNSSVYIEQLKNHTDQVVTLEGWLYNSRASGKIQFLIIRDGTGLCQCIVERGKVSDELFGELKHLGQESSLAVTGSRTASIFCSNTVTCTFARRDSGASGKSATR